MSTKSDETLEIVIDWVVGSCPVQAEGTINGKRFYFQARSDARSLLIGGFDIIVASEWRYDEDYGSPGGYDAGWMTEGEAIAFIIKAAKLYARQC